MSPGKKAAFVIGTIAELIKISPIVSELEKRRIPYEIFFTGQHNIESALKENKMRPPKHTFDYSAKGRGRFSSKLSAGTWVLRATGWVSKKLSADREISLVLIHGDTMTTTAGAIGAKLAGKKLAHIEAGLRSGSAREPFPEELSRRLADSLSDYFFCPTWHSAQNLLSEGKQRSRIFVTGNTNIDVLRSKKSKGSAGIPKGKYAIAKLHRHENITSKERIRKFFRAIELSPLPTILILPENLKRQAEKFKIRIPKTERTEGFLPQKKFLSLLSNATTILTDAGGETEEACYLRVPSIQFRKHSERTEAESTGASVRSIVPEEIAEHLKRAKSGKWKITGNARLVFGEGRASKEIADFVRDFLSGKIR